ncbi:type 1 glutamine amidotransferase domain-containing protein [Ferviditalea candida]|uniref:Type 1 glutamine amidotransferase domain-containing protein n=1 Tax=Ferviditalea candida TaxID=3108399 RepID=A0ABU5ZGX0_9BACL|nr:type 1 glutamine amidotransferase domain-containing protein [Paenibacillaceae bacterium T2]
MNIAGRKVLIFVEHEFEDLEMWYPILRLREAGITVDLAGLKAQTDYLGKYGIPVTTNLSFEQVKSKDYAGLLIPGGWAPDKLRTYPHVIQIAKDFQRMKKPIAAICHAPWVLISAKIVDGYTMTSFQSLKTDLENAGAAWVDKEVVVDRNMISARMVADLPAFVKEFICILENSTHSTSSPIWKIVQRYPDQDESCLR